MFSPPFSHDGLQISLALLKKDCQGIYATQHKIIYKFLIFFEISCILHPETARQTACHVSLTGRGMADILYEAGVSCMRSLHGTLPESFPSEITA